MNKFTVEYLITTSASIYFWLYLSFILLTFLYSFSDEYKENKKRLLELGKYPLSTTISGFIMLFLFILSIYYK